jgi:hypothetical protein
MPDLSEPFWGSAKISHRAWFSLEEYKKLYTATRERAQNPLRPRYRWQSEQLHDFVLFMANTGLRPDEAKRLQFRDVEIVEDEDLGETILEIEVRGKRGTGYCKSTTGAVLPFQRLKSRPRLPRVEGDLRKKSEGPAVESDPGTWPLPKSTDLIFPRTHCEIFNAI